MQHELEQQITEDGRFHVVFDRSLFGFIAAIPFASAFASVRMLIFLHRYAPRLVVAWRNAFFGLSALFLVLVLLYQHINQFHYPSIGTLGILIVGFTFSPPVLFFGARGYDRRYVNEWAAHFALQLAVLFVLLMLYQHFFYLPANDRHELKATRGFIK